MNYTIDGYPTLTQYYDFVEYGLVYQCLKRNSNLSNSVVARQTRLLIPRVISLRRCVERDLSLPSHIELKPTVEKPQLPIKIETAHNAVDEEPEYPVNVGIDYTGRISNLSQTGAGIALINGFACEIPGAAMGELVKFRIRKINYDSAEADLIRVLQKPSVLVSPPVQLPVVMREHTKSEDIGKRCIECNFIVTEKIYETNDGLCTKCYYRKIANEAVKTERHSGLLGTDRASSY